MPSEFDQKEDLRLRMADLEKKLAESEDERCKLEKTCNVLMRAFREQEKMQYKALNKKYEKFLEDCAVRKRRNDIILRSLCRIEDRSRALSAKTERLKLLKDRYISYLKITNTKGDEVHSPSLKTFPLSSQFEKASYDVTPKLLRWTTPLTTYYKPEEAGGDLFPRTGNSQLALVARESFRKEQPEGRETPEVSVINGVKEPVRTSSSPDESNSVKTGSDYVVKENERLADKRENSVSNKELVKNIAEVTALREKKVISHQESIEELKKAFFFENVVNIERPKPRDGKIADEENKQNEASDTPQHRFVTFTAYHEEKQPKNMEIETEDDLQTDQQKENVPVELLRNNTKPLPMGLDGVDYQNETYPESYYEQPVHHHNHTSIASDVILEEDETEEDLDQNDSFREPRPNEEDFSHGSTARGRSPGLKAFDESKSTSETNKEPDKGQPIDGNSDEVKTRESDSDNRQRSDSEKSKRDVTERNKSNLIHLLESDSESFQIEHGDAASGNDDSDFDFSFHQN